MLRKHPKVDYTKHPISDDLETRSLHPKLDHTNHPNLDDFIHFSVLFRQQQTYIIQIWMIYNIIDKSSTCGRFLWITNHPFLDSDPTWREAYHSELTTSSNTLGLITAFKDFTKSDIVLKYQFLHLTIHEFFAAETLSCKPP